MRLLRNIIKWAIVTSGAIILALVTISLTMQNKVAAILLSSLNKGISTKVVTGSYSFSLLRKFPKAVMEINNIVILSSHGFDSREFKGISTDTLMEAKKIHLEFGMKDLINGNYRIERLLIRDGFLALFSDSSGNVNYEITGKENENKGVEGPVNIDLDRVVISGMKIRYINRATRIDLSGVINSGRIRGKFAGNNLDFICNSSFRIDDVGLFGTSLKPGTSCSIDLNLHRSDSGITFRKGNLRIEDFRFGVRGRIGSDDEVDLRVTGQNIRIEKIKKYLPPDIAAKLSEYSPEGLLNTECRIGGTAGRKENPSVDLSFSLDKGNIRYGNSDISLNDLSLTGKFTNGKLRRPESFLLSLDKCHFIIGSARWDGEMVVSDFSDPRIRATFSGEIIPGELLQFFEHPGIVSAQGSARLNLSVDGVIKIKDDFSFPDLMTLNPKADIRFKGFSLKGKEEKLSVEDATGDVMISGNLWADDLHFSWMGQRFSVTGEFESFSEWMSDKTQKMRISASITADNLNPSLLLPDSASIAAGKDKPVMMPDRVEADISFRVNNLMWDLFNADNISGRLSYRPGRIDLRSVSISALNGTASGDGYLVQNRTRGYLAHANLSIENIDINKTFTSFRNFGQTFIVAGNLAGSLSGSLNILMPLDSLLNPVTGGVTAEGRYVITDGELNNFEPVKALSDYIELSELENITFSRLENEIFIRDKYVAVPQMEIKSSAADFTVSGKHGFDNSYEYHVKTNLSLLLSKKAKKQKSTTSEFGAVEDDGLGRTSIFLKITGVDENLKVTYDLKAAGNNLKQNLKKEKGNLRNILNEQYGWFRKDSAVVKDSGSKPKFRIVFPETDSTGTVKDTTTGEKDNKRINRIFKRKSAGSSRN